MLLTIRGNLSAPKPVQSVCWRCLLQLSRKGKPRRSFATSQIKNEPTAVFRTPHKFARREYFSANAILGVQQDQTLRVLSQAETHDLRDALDKSAPAAGSIPLNEDSTPRFSAHQASEPPHRRRKRLKDAATRSISETASPEVPLPLDASARLATLSSNLPKSSFRRLFTTCLSLSKPRLSFLIVLTTATTYSLYPVPALLLPMTTTSPSLSALTLVFLTLGTALTSASANALNMLIEPQYDAQMSRTRNRPLVRGLIGKRGALIFASITGFVGVGSLFFGVNPTVAFLGGFNIFLYAGVYTPMKRLSVLNTWAGAVVGAIPPLMGWAAAAGQSATSDGDWKELLFSEGSVGGWLVAALLFAWQFPHFNSLSWPIRDEYKNAGYRMLAWTNSRMNGRVALRYSVLMFPICYGLWWFQITDTGFLVTSSIVNAWMAQAAWRFWEYEGYKGGARALFWASVWHLPVVMVLAMLHKKGLWENIWHRLSNGNDSEEEVYELQQPESMRHSSKASFTTT